MSYKNLLETGTGVPVATIYGMGSELIELKDLVSGINIREYITEFEYKFKNKEGDEVKIKLQFPTMQSLNHNHFERGTYIRVNWGYISPSIKQFAPIDGPSYTVVITDIETEYSETGYSITLKCTDPAYYIAEKTFQAFNGLNPGDDPFQKIIDNGVEYELWHHMNKAIVIQAGNERGITITQHSNVDGEMIRDTQPLRRVGESVPDITVPRDNTAHPITTVLSPAMILGNLNIPEAIESVGEGAEDGPYNVTGRDNKLIISNYDYFSAPIRTYHWDSPQGELLSITVNTQHKAAYKGDLTSAELNNVDSRLNILRTNAGIAPVSVNPQQELNPTDKLLNKVDQPPIDEPIPSSIVGFWAEKMYKYPIGEGRIKTLTHNIRMSSRDIELSPMISVIRSTNRKVKLTWIIKVNVDRGEPTTWIYDSLENIKQNIHPSGIPLSTNRKLTLTITGDGYTHSIVTHLDSSNGARFQDMDKSIDVIIKFPGTAAFAKEYFFFSGPTIEKGALTQLNESGANELAGRKGNIDSNEFAYIPRSTISATVGYEVTSPPGERGHSYDGSFTRDDLINNLQPVILTKPFHLYMMDLLKGGSSKDKADNIIREAYAKLMECQIKVIGEPQLIANKNVRVLNLIPKHSIKYHMITCIHKIDQSGYFTTMSCIQVPPTVNALQTKINTEVIAKENQKLEDLREKVVNYYELDGTETVIVEGETKYQKIEDENKERSLEGYPHLESGELRVRNAETDTYEPRIK